MAFVRNTHAHPVQEPDAFLVKSHYKNLPLHLHAAPEGDISLNFLGFGFWFGIEPGRIGIAFAVNIHLLVAGGAFQGENGGGLAGRKYSCLMESGGKYWL